MIEYTPPYYLIGEAGRSLDATPRTLAELGITEGTLSLTSLDIDRLTFSIPVFMVTHLIDDGQMITLRDSATPTPRVLFHGKVMRGFQLKAGVYSFQAESVWKQLANAPLGGATNDRPYRVYPSQSIGTTVSSLVGLAQAAGLPVQVGTLPTFYAAPKATLKSRSFAEAISFMLQMVPDAGTRMDYSTAPLPKLTFTRRTAPHVIDVDTEGHGLEDARLVPQEWRRALGVTIHYASRTSYTEASLVTQTGGNTAAEASRQISLMLSGYERTDAFNRESLQAAIQAYNEAAKALSEEGAAIDQIAATALLNVFPQWEALMEIDPAIKAALAAGAFTMQRVGNSSFSFYTYYWRYPGEGANPPRDQTIATVPAELQLANGNQPGSLGLYTIKPNTFTDAHLALAGATKTQVWLRGEYKGTSNGVAFNAGLASLKANNSSKVREFAGYDGVRSSFSQPGGGQEPSQLRRYYFYKPDLPLWAINKTPAQVAAAVKGQIGTDLEELGEQAAFVEPPPGFAQNYFEAQDWTPMTGSLVFRADAPWKPAPGDRVQITGANVDPLWETAEAPVVSVSIDLRTGMLTAQAGFAPRQNISSLLDALRVAPEDNLDVVA
ncbi:hypothetical protein OVA24_16795 [Luteolibacter sp. SL250]|uniref:hypothetical protein n=1 Tax=Luteolibacter sp. SL250 TaxID=2995170 RepID=UPI0022704F46|nr:hypothetical protein [Luteolibacter sp. SL250]WAC18891.1 hypothetical protein OVA24_16795 [Luteolibacter sp. SL250]